MPEPAPATAAPADDDATTAAAFDDGADANHSASDDTFAELCCPGAVDIEYKALLKAHFAYFKA